MLLLLEEIPAMNDAKVMRSVPVIDRITYSNSRPSFSWNCPLCEEARSSDNHFLSMCKFLHEQVRL